MQIDVCQDRADYAALWRSGQRVLSGFVEVLITRLEKLSDDRYEPLIFDFLSEDIEQYFMIDVVKRSHNSIPYSTTRMKKTRPRWKSLIPLIPCSDVALR